MKIQSIYKWCTATVSLVPGVAVILTNLGTLPGVSKLLYGGIVEAAGAFTLLLITVNQQKIRRIPPVRISRMATFTFIGFILSILAYLYLYQLQNVYSSKYQENVFFPFWYTGDLRDLVRSGNGELGAINKWGIQSIRDAIINTEPLMDITLAIFTVIYVAIFEFLIISFGLLGYKKANGGNGMPSN